MCSRSWHVLFFPGGLHFPLSRPLPIFQCESRDPGNRTLSDQSVSRLASQEGNFPKMARSLPPDQSFSLDTLGDRAILHSVSETGIRIDDDKAYGDLTGFKNGSHIFCETVAVSASKVIAPYGLTLSTTTINCAGNVALDSTGDSGKENSGGDGSPGGILTVYVQDLSDKSAQSLTFIARGGDGGNVTSGKDTKVGNGGRGGSIISVLQPTYVQIWDPLNTYYYRDEFHPDDEADYKTPVKREDNLFLAAKGILELSKRLSVTDSVIEETFRPLSEEVSDQNTQTPTVLSIKLAVVKIRASLRTLIADQRAQLAPTTEDVRGGYAGVGVNVDVEAGEDGVSGAHQQIFLQSWSPADLRAAKMPFVHPKQCSMLLARANVFFYMNSPKLRSHARRLYHRIIDRLSFLPLKPTDPLWKAYKESPIMSSTSIQDLEQIKADATIQLTHLDSGEVVSKDPAPFLS